MNITFDMVIHTEFGGFSLTDEIRRRLTERGSEWVDKLGKASAAGQWYSTDDDEFRRDPDLVAVVRELQEELQSRGENLQSWQERAALEQRLLHGLKVVTVEITVEIEDYDGKEQVLVFGYAG